MNEVSVYTGRYSIIIEDDVEENTLMSSVAKIFEKIKRNSIIENLPFTHQPRKKYNN